MSEPFKEKINKESIKILFTLVSEIESSFDLQRACDLAMKDLEALELKARINQVADTIALGLQNLKWQRQTQIASAVAQKGLCENKLTEFSAWPLASFIERHGLQELDSSFKALEMITPVASAEFAVRPFINKYGPQAMQYLYRWAEDENEHVRRLASEGSRPRLPWAPRIEWLKTSPHATEIILDKLYNDKSLYVRRSVANHLADIAKEDFNQALSLAQKWLRTNNEHAPWVVKHAMRVPIKSGNKDALAMFDINHNLPVRVEEFRIFTQEVKIGDALQFGGTVISEDPGNIIVDYIIYFQGAGEKLRQKVFKLTARRVKASEPLKFTRNHSFRPVTTRAYYPGKHRVELQVNGKVVAKGEFNLLTN